MGGSGYLEQLRGKQQEGWLSRQIHQFRGYARLDRVNKLLNEGKLSEARQELEKYLEIAPEDFEARYNYLVILYKLKDYQQAIEQADLILQRHPQFIPAFLYRGLSQQALGHVEKALESFQAAASQGQITPEDRRFALNMAADLAIRQKNYDLALKELEQLKSEADFSLSYRQGLALEGAGRLPEAEQMYRQALNQAGNAPDRLRADLALGELARKRQDWSAASQAFQAASQLEPNNPAVWRALAQTAYNQKDYAASVEYIKRALALKSTPQDREFYVNILGLLQDNRKATSELNGMLAEARTNEEKFRIYTTLGYAYNRWGKSAEAAQAFQAASQLEPNRPEVWRALAQIAYGQKNYAASVENIKRALAIESTPQDREFLINALGLLTNYPEVTKQLNDLLAENPTQEEKVRIYTTLGHAYNRLGKPVEAARAFQEANKLQKTLPTMQSLAQAEERAGRSSQAIAAYQEILKQRPSPQIHLKLGILFEQAGNTEATISHLKQATAGDRSLQLTAYKHLGLIYYRLGQFAEAQQSLEQALALQPNNPELNQALAETALKLGAPERALTYRKKATELTSHPEAAGRSWQDLGLMAMNLGHYQEAAGYFNKAMAAGQDSWEIRQNLGIIYFKSGKLSEAMTQFGLALKARRAPQTLVYLGMTYQKMNKPGLAVPYLEEAKGPRERLTPTERREALDTLGYLYADEKEYAQAAKAWSQSLALQRDPLIVLNLAKMQRRQGQYGEALTNLESIDPAELPPASQAERLDEMAACYKETGQSPKALEVLEMANQLKSTPARDYQIGLTYKEAGKLQEAIPYLQKAVSQDPQNNEYKVTLGYAYLGQKNFLQAARLFEEVLKSDPNYPKLYGDLGYAYMHAAKNDQAVEWFKKAIDKQLLEPESSAKESEESRQEVYRYRQEVTKMSKEFDFTAYLSYQTAKPSQSVAPGLLGGGAVPSQGGVELAYKPPVIGFRDERIFQVFTRVLWNIVPGSMRFNEDSFQGGVGMRYKPLQSQNLYLSGERLFKMGDKALNTWLLHLLYSWDYGYDLKPGKAQWNYTFLYGDAAYFTKDPGIWAYYGEIREGWTFNFNDKFLLTPHLVADVRYQDPHSVNSSYLEGGVGISLKYLFMQSRYEIHRASFEILAYYKHGNFLNRTFRVSGDKYDGFFTTAIVHF